MQRKVFSIRVIGLIQSLVTPALGKIYCGGLWEVVLLNQEIDQRAASFNNVRRCSILPFFTEFS